jgi:hypothetical protein
VGGDCAQETPRTFDSVPDCGAVILFGHRQSAVRCLVVLARELLEAVGRMFDLRPVEPSNVSANAFCVHLGPSPYAARFRAPFWAQRHVTQIDEPSPIVSFRLTGVGDGAAVTGAARMEKFPYSSLNSAAAAV